MRFALAAIAVAIVAVLLWALVLRGEDGTVAIVRGDPTFNVLYGDELRRLAPRDGEQLRLVGPAGRLFTVTPLRLPPYKGDVNGLLPIYSTRLADAMAPRYPGFAVRYEGRARVNDTPGYELVFQYRRAGRVAYGRRVLLLPEVPGVRKGADVLLLEDRSQAVPRADAIGRNGALKKPLRSFRFGTDRP